MESGKVINRLWLNVILRTPAKRDDEESQIKCNKNKILHFVQNDLLPSFKMTHTVTKLLFSNVVLVFLFCIESAIAQDINTYISQLNSSSETVVISAIQGLGRIVTNESTKVLVERLSTEKKVYLKMQLIEALAVHRSTTALKAVLSTLNDSNQYVRQRAMSELAYFGDDVVISSAISKAIDTEKDETVKLQAMNTLNGHKNKTAVGAIGKIIKNDKKASLRKTAEEILKRINTNDAWVELDKYKTDTVLGNDIKKYLKGKKIKK